MTAQRIDAVVLSWQDDARTLHCLRNLASDPDINKIWVVDNESAKSLRPLLESAWRGRVELLEQTSNLGFSAGMNIGLRAARLDGADVILAHNNDACFRTGGVRELLDVLESDPTIGAVAPLITNQRGEVLSSGGRFRPWLMETRDDIGRVKPPDYLTWASILIPCKVLELVGELSEDFFMYWEDVDFGIRCMRAGLRFTVVTDVVVEHDVSSSHARAGHNILLFSVLGLMVLTRRVSGIAWLGLVIRGLARTLRQLARRDIAGVHAIVQGLLIGARVGRDKGAYDLLLERAIVHGEPRVRGKSTASDEQGD
jgi:GT2 family glycosyltransferase